MVTEIVSDVCIVGSGPAGLTLAGELGSTSLDVVVLERGGRRLDATRRRQNTIEIAGHPLGRMDQIRRFGVGGAGWIWSGITPELQRVDLEPAPWAGLDGWPLSYDDLVPYYARARGLMGLPDPEPALARSVSEDLEVVPVYRTKRRFGRRPPAGSTLRATVTRLIPSPDGTSLEGVELVQADGGRVVVRSKVFVLAPGGIENPRLLLHSGVANSNDLVGRYFSDHPYVSLPVVIEGAGPPPSVAWVAREGPRSLLALSPAARIARRSTGAAAFVRPGPDLADGEPGVEAWRDLRWALRHREPPAAPMRTLGVALGNARTVASATAARRRSALSTLRVVVESRPDPESTVTLSEQRDELGVPTPRVDWRLGSAAESTFNEFLDAVTEATADLGFRLAEDAAESWPKRVDHGAHHMGTTRMHHDPALGVVDSVGKIHGVDNLYVAGSSTFPTYGTANPTLTIVALAIRLADHLTAE